MTHTSKDWEPDLAVVSTLALFHRLWEKARSATDYEEKLWREMEKRLRNMIWGKE
jgi:hypothetical protein